MHLNSFTYKVRAYSWLPYL